MTYDWATDPKNLGPEIGRLMSALLNTLKILKGISQDPSMAHMAEIKNAIEIIETALGRPRTFVR